MNAHHPMSLVEITPCYRNSVPGTVYMELVL